MAESIEDRLEKPLANGLESIEERRVTIILPGGFKIINDTKH